MSKRVLITGAASDVTGQTGSGAKRGRFRSTPRASEYLARLTDQPGALR